MKRIGIERDRERGSAGLIEGETDTGQRWIMYLDELGRPEVFWRERDETGAVIGEGIKLAAEVEMERSVERYLKITLEGEEELVSTFPVFTPETWPRNEGDDPTTYTGLQRGVVFCVAQEGEDRADAMRRFVRELNEFYDAEEALGGE
jgi:hypothetical protein